MVTRVFVFLQAPPALRKALERCEHTTSGSTPEYGTLTASPHYLVLLCLLQGSRKAQVVLGINKNLAI